MMLRLLSLLALFLAGAAQAAPAVPEPPPLDAKSYVLMDAASGQVLAARDPDARMEPASLTKLMTLYVAFDELKKGRVTRDDEVLVSEKAWRQGYSSRESRMFIEVGKRVRFDALLHGVIIQSGNDASVAVAEHIAGSEELFAGLMNQHARTLGLANSHFMNATGIPHPELYTTARDVALLARALVRDFPEDYALFKEKEFTYNSITQPNRNLLLWRDPTVDGIKTGHTEAAGFCLASSALREGRRLIAIVMGSKDAESRARASLTLLNYGFRFFETYELTPANTTVASVRVWKGEEREVALGLAAPLVVTVPRGMRERVQVQAQMEPSPFAPVAAGQRLGTLTIALDGKALRTEPLIALRAMPEGNLWRQLSDEVRLRLGRSS
ncbi:MAG: D-alanyl-D-alanine carboxypeptidase [Gammaproteobacteria bacterium]|nr:D-alanyl-D-alanine carboxypeptidase [Gammaproteobacteria bacterium]